ncbi:hypothetical protein QMZ92_16500 [Streptomyces sp. HNM0645]|uniref:hypothetical protein n=1 Tax=Streptomyces sp. HNM0645 TaxID=2782343 RepID=UPI0024B7BD06|nr:hypothetical protein [Streptomyces sp. HNM0645]MDI9885936.1 hypothetical protein [Streptomyces sp. HNM0645]
MTTAPTLCITERCTRTLRDWELAARMVCCSICHDQMRHWLQQIPAALIVLRDGSMQRERTSDSGGRGGTRTPPLPCREDVLSFVGPAATGTVHDPHGDQTGSRPIIDTLGSWARLVCEERNLAGPARWTETELASWLIPQLGFATTQAWVADLHRELFDMAREIRGIARTGIRTEALSRPCPRCEDLLLQRTDHDLYIRCTGCGTAFTQTELNDDAPRQLEAINPAA